MNIATEEETLRFLNVVWIDWGTRLVRQIAAKYELDEEQADALQQVLVRPNDWLVEVETDQSE
jgi:hypothetical protein